MARKRKVARRRKRRSTGIGALAPRRRRSGGGAKGGGIMDAVTIAGGLVLGKIVDKMLADKVEALKDGKIRGAALAAVGIFGGRMLPANLKGVANGIAASGIYTIAKEVMPDTINGFDEDAVGQLSPAEVDLIESMAIESEVSGLDQDVSSTVTGNMDSDVMSTVTGMDEDEEDEEENF